MSETPRIVLYDGECGLCDRSVRWLLDHDVERRLHYAALQGETAAALRARFPEIPARIDTVVYVEQSEPARAWLRSAAVFRLCAQLPAPWRWLAVLRLVPAPLMDLLYRAVARVRHRLFPPPEACAVPAPELRARFLP